MGCFEAEAFSGAIVVVLLIVIHLSGGKKNGSYFGRGAFMRDLNKKMEADLSIKVGSVDPRTGR